MILPVCWCHGDRADDWPALGNGTVFNREWLRPELISEIIGRAEFLFASSLHACITAVSYGVPAARVPISSDRKYELLNEFQGIRHIDDHEGVCSLIKRGRYIEPLAVEYADRVDRYWDELKEIVLAPPVEHCNRSISLMLRWVATACGDRERMALKLACRG